MQQPTIQSQMRNLLAESGIAHKEIRCYGRQIVVTSWSREAADQWAHLLSEFATVRAVTESLDERHDAESGTRPSKKYIRVFRTFAALAEGAQTNHKHTPRFANVSRTDGLVCLTN